MRYWFDAEFIEDGRTIDLLSIGIVAEDGRTLYLENSEAKFSLASQWVKDNVVLIGRSHNLIQIKTAVANFCDPDLYGKPEFWAYYGSYDWVALCQLFGTMMDIPKGWPMFVKDIKQWCDMLGNPTLPNQTTPKHHALNDAIWTKEAWQFLFSKWEQEHNESPRL
jgi:hypothetical protein